MNIGSKHIQNPFAIVVSGADLGIAVVIRSNAVVYYAELKD
jgi:hypothetical protein